ncbi:MAG: P-type conjugative transfer protein TrbL [Betaproteobacteria bacterium]|nr:P-type conjugative transfer protein TrbL [Betaproteobacteria bacterium]
MKKTNLRLLALATLFFLPAVASAAGIFDTFQSSFAVASSGWFAKAQGYGRDLFAALAGIEVIYMSLQWVLDRKTFDELLPILLRKILTLGFFAYLLLNAGTIFPTIIRTFATVGANVAGVQQLTPSTLVDEGDAVAYGIMTGDYSPLARFNVTVPNLGGGGGGSSGASQNTCSILNVYCKFSNTANALKDSVTSALNKLVWFLTTLGFAALTWFCFLMIAIELLVTTIEAAIVVGLAPFFLGFGGSRWTTQFAQGPLNYAVSVGVKLMILYMIIGVLMASVIPSVVTQLVAGGASNSLQGGLSALLSGSTGIVLMFMLAKAIPSKAQSLLSGGSFLGGAHAIKEATGGGGALAGQAALGAASAVAVAATGGAGLAARAAGGSISGGVGNGGESSPIPVPAGNLARSAASAVQAGAGAPGAAGPAIPVPGAQQSGGAPSMGGTESATALSPIGPPSSGRIGSPLGQKVSGAIEGQHGAGQVQANHINLSHGKE